MYHKIKAALASALLVGGILTLACGAAEATGPEVPQSLKLEHDAVIDELAQLASRADSVGIVAGKALPIMKAHFAKETEFVFPPLGLLPTLAAGRQITSDMRAAIAMTERAKAAEQDLWNEHVQITSLMNDIIAASKSGSDQLIVNFATRVAAHSLNEIEVLLPAAIVIGDYLRGKIPAGQ
jgi:hypothetical protein